MAEIRGTKVEQGQTKLRSVPIAVTPEGFWCCPSPVGFQKTLKPQNPLNKPKPSPLKKNTLLPEKKPINIESKQSIVSNEQKTPPSDASNAPMIDPSVPIERKPRQKIENVPKKVSVEFGEAGTSDLRVILMGKQGFVVKLSVHRSVLVENSSFFANKISEEQPIFPCIEIDDCEDVEVYVETVGLMYCKEIKQRLIKQNVSHVLRILKIAEQLGFKSCVESCLEYLEAAPWVGEEEEEKVVSSVLRLQSEGSNRVNPVLKRVSSNITKPPQDTLLHILDLVLKSNEEKGRREMKSIVLKLLKEQSNSIGICYDMIYRSCKGCLDLLLSLFKQAVDPEFNPKDAVMKQIIVQADNVLWLVEILADKQVADEFAVLWARQDELALLHSKLPLVSRYHVSLITARLFVGIGKGELLPLKDTRLMLLQTWLEPLISDYSWLQHGCRSFDRKVVEEGIGRTILTLPLDDQQTILLSWLGSFLKGGDNCPNLQKAFEVWWRRTFIKPCIESGK